jgi:hypothetical protein
MKRVFASVLVACLLGSTPGFARGGVMPGAGVGHGSGRGDFGRNPTTLPAMQNRIPAPLPPPPQAPITNGPCSKGSCL